MENSNFDFNKGYGGNKIVLMTVSPEMLFAYWEMGKKEQEKIKNMPKCREGGLVLRILDSRSLPVKTIKIGDDNFLGSYYLKREHGIEPDTKYFAEISFFDGGFYSKLTEKSNEVTTPRDNISNDTSCEFYDPIKEALEKVRLGKEERRRSLELIRKADEQIKKDRKSSDFFHNYFIKENLEKVLQ